MSLPEAFGRVAVETVACGKSVVASSVGGLPEVVLDSVLVEPGNVRALREVIRVPARRVQMGIVGRQCMRLFAIGTVADRIGQIYAELLNN